MKGVSVRLLPHTLGRREHTDDFADDLGAVCSIGEDNCTDAFRRDKEGVGVHSGVRAGVVDDMTPLWTIDLPAQTHPAEMLQAVPEFRRRKLAHARLPLSSRGL